MPLLSSDCMICWGTSWRLNNWSQIWGPESYLGFLGAHTPMGGARERASVNLCRLCACFRVWMVSRCRSSSLHGLMSSWKRWGFAKKQRSQIGDTDKSGDTMSKVQGGMKCVKYLLFVFNFIFWVSLLHKRLAWEQQYFCFYMMKQPDHLFSVALILVWFAWCVFAPPYSSASSSRPIADVLIYCLSFT